MIVTTAEARKIIAKPHLMRTDEDYAKLDLYYSVEAEYDEAEFYQD